MSSRAAPALPTLRERKRRQTRDALAASALRLARAHGFERVTIEQIAADADVARRTFFRYFASKEAALFPHHASRLDYFRARLHEAAANATPFGAVEHAFLALGAVYMREREEIVAQQQLVDASPALLALERSLDREWEQAVAAALEPRRRDGAKAGRRARILAGATMGAIRATLREWFDSGGRLDLVALGRETFAQLGLADEPAAAAPRRR